MTTTSQSLELELEIQELELMELELELKQGLPHLYGYKFYKWARIFFESVEKENFLVAANQISKSSTQIRKCIEWATNTELWPKLWPAMTPNQFWYLYPNKDTATIEFETKWKQFLPRGKFKEHPLYGWKEFYKDKQIHHIVFNSGVTVYFKTYAQNVHDLQSGTVFAIFFDEELPVDLLPELQMRLAATDGYMHGVFTATIGQDYWRRTIEPLKKDEELHIHALKQQISMYDCLFYEDGTPSHWTEEKIERQKKKCGSQAEILKRIFGRFVKSGGLKFESFDQKKNTAPPTQLPNSWLMNVYTAVDIGSGGENHPAAAVFLAVSPDFTKGRVFKGWRGDEQVTTATDVLHKYIMLRGKLSPISQAYDWESKDFGTIAERRGESFVRAVKDYEAGISLMNVLFKNNMLTIDTGDPELEKLIAELVGLTSAVSKQNAKDDFADALRYAVMEVPWDFSAIDISVGVDGEIKPDPVTLPKSEPDLRREFWLGSPGSAQESHQDVDEELDEWNELY